VTVAGVSIKVVSSINITRPMLIPNLLLLSILLAFKKLRIKKPDIKIFPPPRVFVNAGFLAPRASRCARVDINNTRGRVKNRVTSREEKRAV
jgi:hypothetical protein